MWMSTSVSKDRHFNVDFYMSVKATALTWICHLRPKHNVGLLHLSVKGSAEVYSLVGIIVQIFLLRCDDI